MKQIGKITENFLKVIPRLAQSETLNVVSMKSEIMMKHYPTKIDFASNFNLDNCLEKYSDLKTIEQALKSGKIKLIELTSCYEEKTILFWIQAWLVSLSVYMNFSINESQAKNTAIFILEDCYMLNLAEFTLLFKKIIRGNYGVFYSKFNGQIIISACKQYIQQRGMILSKMSEEERISL
jgi:hypothetical protein